jgi:hypothetical protein
MRDSFLTRHMRVERQDGWDLDDVDHRDCRSTVCGEAARGVHGLLGLDVVGDRDEEVTKAESV